MPLPDSSAFLDGVRPQDLDNSAGLSLAERALLLSLLRAFFGPAQAAGAVKDVSEPTSLAELDQTMRRPGERFDQLERQSSLGHGHFAGHASPSPHTALAVAKQDNNELPPSYFVYERQHNLVLYVGPDFFHGMAEHTVVNCLPLDPTFRPLSSHTLRF